MYGFPHTPGCIRNGAINQYPDIVRTMQFNHKNWVHKVYTILSDESQPGGHFLLEIDNNEE